MRFVIISNIYYLLSIVRKSLLSVTLLCRHVFVWLVALVLPWAGQGRPGMLTWVCRTCPNHNMLQTATADIRC